MAAGIVEGLATVTIREAPNPPALTLPKLSERGDTVTSVPTPEAEMDFGAPLAKLMVIAPGRGPAAPGTNAMVRTQVWPQEERFHKCWSAYSRIR